MFGKMKSLEELRALEVEQLEAVAGDLRRETIEAVSITGGHLGAGLGVVELTVALHYVFDTPRDRLIWDVGHQTYPHKILTGRHDRIRTLRLGGGLSGFTKRSESEYDPFGAAHAATSISAALGMALARDLRGQSHHVVAVIGDGSMSAGMAYEALNHAGSRNRRLIVILNDNTMSIAPPVGALNDHLCRMTARKVFGTPEGIMRQFARGGFRTAANANADAPDTADVSAFFEELGFRYVGPVDGHDVSQLVSVLSSARDAEIGPLLIHAVTVKGKGYSHAEAASDRYHGVVSFDVATGKQAKTKAAAPSYTKVFGEALAKEAAKDDRIVAITAAMPSGTGVDIFAKSFPDRAFDVGIAEQHAVTFAAGLAAEGYKPFCAIYSTFLQRGYDQVVHDVALQSLPVRFAIDRAGLVGADGPTHAGSFDVAYLGCLPGFVIMAASDEAELVHMIATAAAIDDRPSAVRYPRGDGVGVELPANGVPMEIGKGRVVRHGDEIALLSLGTRLTECLKAADVLSAAGFSTTVADARFAKPLDVDMVVKLARQHSVLVTIEEGSIGGFGSFVLHALSDHGLLDGSVEVRSMVLPDVFLPHDTPAAMYSAAKLDATAIVDKVFDVLRGHPRHKSDPRLAAASSNATRPPMRVVLAQPRGFCAGVVRAIETVERALKKHDAPVYVRHEIVHNAHVVDGLKEKGARFVETLSDIPDDAVAIFSAHGVPRSVETEAAQRKLVVHDATCPLVTKVHNESRRYIAKGRRLILIGHAKHPEVIGTMGQVGGPVTLVQNECDVETLDIAADTPLAYVTQTTLSVDDTKGIIAALHRRFSNVVGPDTRDICYATQNRQTAVRELSDKVDVMIIVGAKNSSNSNRLYEISVEMGVQSHLIPHAGELQADWFRNARAVGITAGASAPEELVEGVVAWLKGLGPIEISTLEGREEKVEFQLPLELANV